MGKKKKHNPDDILLGINPANIVPQPAPPMEVDISNWKDNTIVSAFKNEIIESGSRDFNNIFQLLPDTLPIQPVSAESLSKSSNCELDSHSSNSNFSSEDEMYNNESKFSNSKSPPYICSLTGAYPCTCSNSNQKKFICNLAQIPNPQKKTKSKSSSSVSPTPYLNKCKSKKNKNKNKTKPPPPSYSTYPYYNNELQSMLSNSNQEKVGILEPQNLNMCKECELRIDDLNLTDSNTTDSNSNLKTFTDWTTKSLQQILKSWYYAGQQSMYQYQQQQQQYQNNQKNINDISVKSEKNIEEKHNNTINVNENMNMNMKSSETNIITDEKPSSNENDEKPTSDNSIIDDSSCECSENKSPSEMLLDILL